MERKSITQPLSKKAEKLITSFDEAAQLHGWEQDQGNEEEANKAKIEWKRTLRSLRKYVLKLETQLSKCGNKEE